MMGKKNVIYIYKSPSMQKPGIYIYKSPSIQRLWIENNLYKNSDNTDLRNRLYLGLQTGRCLRQLWTAEPQKNHWFL